MVSPFIQKANQLDNLKDDRADKERGELKVSSAWMERSTPLPSLTTHVYTALIMTYIQN